MREIKYRQLLNNGTFHYWGFTPDMEFHSPVSHRVKSDQLTCKRDCNGKDVYIADIIKIDRDDYTLIGEVKQLDGGQFYINHKRVSLKYAHQIHCEVCETDSPVFFLDYFEPYEIEIIGNIHQNPELLP